MLLVRNHAIGVYLEHGFDVAQSVVLVQHIAAPDGGVTGIEVRIDEYSAEYTNQSI